MLKHELRNFVSGTGKTKQENLIQTKAGYLATSKTAGKKTEISKLTKQEEAKLITEYVNLHSQWNIEINESRFIAEGAEQKVYLNVEGDAVIKLNSSVFYFILDQEKCREETSSCPVSSPAKGDANKQPGVVLVEKYPEH